MSAARELRVVARTPSRSQRIVIIYSNIKYFARLATAAPIRPKPTINKRCPASRRTGLAASAASPSQHRVGRDAAMKLDHPAPQRQQQREARSATSPVP